MFKSKTIRPGAGHSTTQQAFYNEVKLDGSDFSQVQTDLVALVKVAKRYNRYEAECHIFDTRMPLRRERDYMGNMVADGYMFLKSLITISLVQTDWMYYIRTRASIYQNSNSEEAAKDLATFPSMRCMFSEERMHDYIQIMITIPEIAREIHNYLPRTK